MTLVAILILLYRQMNGCMIMNYLLWLTILIVRQCFFLFNFCYSGGYADNLEDISSSMCRNRTIHTACDVDELTELYHFENLYTCNAAT